MPDTSPATTERRECQLCACKALKRFVVPDVTQLWMCPNCGLFQYGPHVQGDAYDQCYQTGYKPHRRRKLRTAKVRLNRIAPLLKTDSPRLLDIGCSIGTTVEAAIQRGWEAVGVDVNINTVHECRKRGLNCEVTNGFELPFDDQSIDIITAWHVIEHVADVKQTLAEWRRVLRDEGVVAIETPDASSRKVRSLGARYRRFWAPEHTYTFTPATLKRFFRQAGFRITYQPILGRLTDLSPIAASYTVAYQAQNGLKRLLGVNKAFQLFARRHNLTSQSPYRNAA